jgi:hypothetical protein
LHISKSFPPKLYGLHSHCVYLFKDILLSFLDIENELVNIIEKDMKCALVGDFNPKTAVLEDFSEPDETFLNVMDVNVEDGLFRYHIAMTTKFYLIIIFP